jgi:predicted ATPase/DNA-binding SARP family transcriptional activator
VAIEFRILGPLEVREGGRALTLGGPKPRALLMVLLLHRNEPVSAERLAISLWGEDAPASAIKTVQVHVSRLRKALGNREVLTTTPAGYRLLVRPGELDADHFEQLVAEGREALDAGDCDRATTAFRTALSVWRGPAMADLAFAAFAQGEIARLEERRLVAVEGAVEADLAAGRHREVVAELEALVAEHPLSERLQAQRMLALYRCGRQAEALAAYRGARASLVEGLGIEPGPELRELERAILAQEVAPAPRIPVAPAVTIEPAGEPAGIPVPPTQTIGRDAELERLCDLLRQPVTRLVTIVGPGGVGKTRLAIVAARALEEELEDGAHFVSLVGLEPDDVASTVARELGVQPLASESPERALARHLRRRRLLLVLDNFEQVIDAATVVAELLAHAPAIVLLVTSRAPLRLRGEQVVRLDPLPPAFAVELFLQLARARDRAFELAEGNGSAVLELCRALDGLPLAIELAAARHDLLSVPELLEELRGGLDAPGAAARDAPARQHTLAATLDWSCRLLEPEEEAAFAAMAAFAGGGSLQAAGSVTGASLEVLGALVDKSLLIARRDDSGRVRLAMLETVRRFALRRLDRRADAETVRRRHYDHFLALAEGAMPEVRRSQAPELLADLDRELDNFRAALSWAIDRSDATSALRLSELLSLYWGARALRREGAQWLRRALELPGATVPSVERADALVGLAYALFDSEPEQAEAAARESLALRESLGDREGSGRSMRALAFVLVWGSRNEEAFRWASEAESVARVTGDEPARTEALMVMAQTAPSVEDALALGEEAVRRLDSAGHRIWAMTLMSGLSYQALGLGDDRAAQRLSADALERAKVCGAREELVASTHGNAALAALFAGDLARAQDGFATELNASIRLTDDLSSPRPSPAWRPSPRRRGATSLPPVSAAPPTQPLTSVSPQRSAHGSTSSSSRRRASAWGEAPGRPRTQRVVH